VEVEIVELITTDLLSQKTLEGPSIGMPSILSLYCKDSSISTMICKAIISDPNVEDSTVFCALENQVMGVQLR
jgi:hypothetical protein